MDPEIAAEVHLQEETRRGRGGDGPVETVLNFRDDNEEEARMPAGSD